MKKIEAIIRTSRFEEVHSALVDAGVSYMSFYEVKGFGLQPPHAGSYRGARMTNIHIPRTKLEIVVNDNFSLLAIEALLKSAATGEVGDGKIFVVKMADAIRIRDGQKGGEALN